MARVTLEDELLQMRERKTLLLLCTGLSAGRIAAKRSINVHTLRSQIAVMYRKLGVNDRAAAVARFLVTYARDEEIEWLRRHFATSDKTVTGATEAGGPSASRPLPGG